MPHDIRITTLNWDHATGQRYNPGQRLSARHAEELRNCYSLLAGAGKGSVRVETPE